MFQLQKRIIYRKEAKDEVKDNRVNKREIESNRKNPEINIDYNKLAEAIVNAQIAVAKNEEENLREREEVEIQEWRKLIGYVENTHKNPLLKLFFDFRNSVVILIRAVFFKKKDAKTARITLGLMRLALEGILGLCKWVLYTITGLIIWSCFQRMAYYELTWALLPWLLARMFRIAIFEVENMRNESILMSIFSAFTSFVAMVIALIALLCGNG